MNQQMKTSEILDLAADEILGRGWLQGDKVPGTGLAWGGGAGGTGPLCMEGGILAAMGVVTDAAGLPPRGFRTCPAYKAVEEYLDEAGGAYYFLFDFNDARGRTAEEVIEVLRAAAAVERVKEATYEGADVIVASHNAGDSAAPAYDNEDQPLPIAARIA